jgi:glycosyltransferase involved in cell wall biosynthesis
MIKVLGLALYGPLAASTRYRLGQYVSGLKVLGIDLQIKFLLNDDYLRTQFSGGHFPYVSVVKSVFSRFQDLLLQKDFDLVILHCELIPLFPGVLEKILIRKPYIYDFDDAFFLKYHIGRLSVTKSLLGRKFEKVIAGASAVSAGNSYLASYASAFNKNTHYLPTVVDTSRYLPNKLKINNDSFTVGWIGSPSTAKYLNTLVGPLSSIGLEGPVRFIVIGGKAPPIPNVNVVEIAWDENTEINLINTFDVGVMPLYDDEWSRGKCAFKLIQYMACSVAVIASPIGANIDLINGGYGLLASTQQDWEKAFRTLRDAPQKRIQLSKAGRARVVANYSLEKNLPILAKLIKITIEQAGYS